MREEVAGRGGPPPAGSSRNFSPPHPTSQERDVASDAPEASATESPGQWKASVAARGGGKTAENSGLKPTHLTAPGEGTKLAVAPERTQNKGEKSSSDCSPAQLPQRPGG